MWLGRVFVSRDKHLPKESVLRQRTGKTFSGVICAHQMSLTVGQCVRDLEPLAKANDPADFADRIEYLPLR